MYNYYDVVGDYAEYKLQMARKDARLMQHEAEGAGKALPGTAAIAKEMDKRLAEGNAKMDWMIVASGSLQ